MQFDDDSFSDSSLRDALSREVKSHSASSALRDRVELLFDAQAAPVKGGGVGWHVPILVCVVMGIVVVAGYQVYDSFFANHTVTIDPEVSWQVISTVSIPQGGGVGDIKNLTTSSPVSIAMLPANSARLLDAYADDVDCGMGGSLMVQYAVGSDSVLLLTVNANSLSSPDGSDEYQKSYDQTQVYGVKRSTVWIVGVAPKSFSTTKLIELVKSAEISKTTPSTTEPATPIPAQ